MRVAKPGIDPPRTWRLAAAGEVSTKDLTDVVIDLAPGIFGLTAAVLEGVAALPPQDDEVGVAWRVVPFAACASWLSIDRRTRCLRCRSTWRGH